ncbi:MAG: Wzz/FepE/Etk N-terminal domain-containing protein [Candidatus Krumholzibacteriia bacterium]
MDLRSLVEVLIRRRWIIVLVALPVILVALVGTMRSTQMFRARTTLMIEIGGAQNPRFYERAQNLDMILSSAAELAMSSPVASLAAEALQDSIPAFKREYPEWFANVNTVHDLGEVLHAGANSTHVGESNLLNLSFSHPDAGFALIGAGALANAYIDFNVRTKRNSPAVSYYAEQIQQTKAEIDSLMVIRMAVLDESGVLGLQADLKDSMTQIRGLESEYFKARSTRLGMEAELASLEQAIAEDPDYIPAVPNHVAASLNRLKADWDTKVARIAELNQRYTEESVWVQRERAQLELIRQEMFQERDRYLETLRIELAQTRAVEESYRAAQLDQSQGIQNYPDVLGQIELLDLQIDGLKKLLQSFQLKHGEVRMASNSDIRVTDAFLIEAPTLDVAVGRGRKMLYLIISVVLAVAMGLVAAFFVESNDHRIYDRRRAELYLEVPVLGSLPDTTRKTHA